MKKGRHVLGISGGKDSAALAIYMFHHYPELDVQYYFCDTGKELPETYTLIDNLEHYLGKQIIKLAAADQSHQNPFDHYLSFKRKFLPSQVNRWCTEFLKLQPFEKWIGDDPVISYVGIRGDEDREGYVSKKSNIQSIFPFRKNIWSQDVIDKVLKNDNIFFLETNYQNYIKAEKLERVLEIVSRKLSPRFNQQEKLNSLLDLDIVAFNKVVFAFLKSTEYPLSNETEFPLVSNTEILIRDDIFKLLEDSGVGVPKYYEKIDFEVDGQIASYSRSRSGCFFCFYQQKIEWVWLLEQHPDLFKKAMEYEKDGYTWSQNESLEKLCMPERVLEIKREFIKRSSSQKEKSPYLIDMLEDAEGEGCAACFI